MINVNIDTYPIITQPTANSFTDDHHPRSVQTESKAWREEEEKEPLRKEIR